MGQVEIMPIRDLSKVAIFIRCHKFSLKCAHLFCELHGGVGYDLFFMTDDTHGMEDYGDHPRVSFTWDCLKDFAVDPSYHYAIVHYGDLMPSVFARAKPGYSHYVMLDFDIHFSYLGRSWMETFCHLLRASETPVDMVAPQIGPSNPTWMWHAAAEKRFSHVMASFFPLVALSERAVRCNEARRIEEAQTRAPTDEPVFCEAFLPSALHEAGYNVVHLNTLLPGSYALSSFDFTLPAPFRREDAGEIGRLIHPIKAMADAPLPRDAMARVLEVEPNPGRPISSQAAFQLAAELVTDQAAYRGLNP